MANSDQELAKMIKSFRVSDLQTLLVYAGRNKNGKKPELQYRALELIKLRSAAIDMKIREIHMNKFGGHSRVQAVENADIYSSVPALPGHTRANRPIVMPNPNRNGPAPAYIEDGYDPVYPRNPDVHFRELPLFDVLAELIRPTNLVKLTDGCYKENEYVFYFTPQQVTDLQTNPDVSVQVRMCLLDTSSEQDDEIPASCCLKVNYLLANLPALIPTNRPGAEPRRPKRPIDITSLIKKSVCDANIINVSWASTTETRYVVGCYLVKRVTSTTLIRRLKAKGVRNPDHTTSIIKEKLLQEQDSEIASSSLKGSLLCPLGKVKMQLPTRALTCTHLQCFDGNLFIQMNEKKPKWICPVCDKPAYFKNLVIDGLFLDIISKAPKECNEVQFHEDGSWTPAVAVKKQEKVSEATIEPTPTKIVPKVVNTDVAKPKKPVEVISLDSDSDTEDSWSIVLPPKKKACKPLSLSMSPVLLESPENTQESQVKSEEVKIKPLNPFLPSTSKQEQPCTAKPYPTIPERSSLPPLPESLNIDSSDVDCILGNIPSTSGAGTSSNYENVTPAESPDVYVPPKSTFPESVEVSPNSARHFSNFDLFSLIQPNQDVNYNFPPAADGDTSPDIINID